MDLSVLEQKLNFRMKNKKLFQQAFTHTSYAYERPSEKDNERLEYLGDAVLELAVSEYLFYQYPQMDEGELTRTRAQIVCEPSLAAFAKELDFGRYMRLGRGAEQTGGRSRPSLLCDVFEAFVGALYLDQGFLAVQTFLKQVVFPKIDDEWFSQVNNRNPKSQLQEWVQQRRVGRLEYRIVDIQGPDHNRRFVAEVYLNNRKWGRGAGNSKQEAEKQAAAEALKHLKKG